MRNVTVDSTNQSIRVWAYDDSGDAVIGEAYNSAGIAVSAVVRQSGRIVSTIALTLVARSGTGVHTDSAFTEVGSGEYVVDLADSYFTTATNQISVTLTSTAITGGYVLSESLMVIPPISDVVVVSFSGDAATIINSIKSTGESTFTNLNLVPKYDESQRHTQDDFNTLNKTADVTITRL